MERLQRILIEVTADILKEEEGVYTKDQPDVSVYRFRALLRDFLSNMEDFRISFLTVRCDFGATRPNEIFLEAVMSSAFSGRRRTCSGNPNALRLDANVTSSQE